MGSYATLDDFGRRTRSGIQESLFSGEEFCGAIDVFDSLRPSRRTKLILTDQRLIAFKRGMIRQSIEDYDRDRISSVGFEKGIIYRKLKVNGSGFSKKWTVDRADGQQFSAALRHHDASHAFNKDSASTESNTSTAGVTDGLEEPKESITDSDASIEEAPHLTNPDAEIYGYNNWHYATIAAAVLGFLGSIADITGVFGIGLVATGVFLYLDSQYMQKASTWRPRTWLYIVGLLFVFLSLPVYLYRRHKVKSRTRPQTDTKLSEAT